MTQPATPSTIAAPVQPGMPYAGSWIDQLVGWIERLPGPTWAFYVIALIVFAVLNNAAFWIDGSLTAGTFDPVKTSDTVPIVFFLGLYHHLRVVAGQSLDAYQPVLKAAPGDLPMLGYRLTHMPRRIGWLTIVIGIAIGVGTIQSDPASVGLDNTHTLPPVIYQHVALSFTVVSMAALVCQTVRQLRLVNALHGRASEIDIFHLGPVHAFARFTARAGTGLLIFVAYNSLLGFLTNSGAPLAAIVVLSALAASVFVIPLLGMRKRLQDEIHRHLRETNDAIKVTISRVHDQVNSDSVERIAGLNTTLTALLAERTYIKGISTWPWGGSTFTGFLSTLLVPVVLWLVTRLLSRVF